MHTADPNRTGSVFGTHVLVVVKYFLLRARSVVLITEGREKAAEWVLALRWKLSALGNVETMRSIPMGKRLVIFLLQFGSV